MDNQLPNIPQQPTPNMPPAPQVPIEPVQQPQQFPVDPKPVQSSVPESPVQPPIQPTTPEIPTIPQPVPQPETPPSIINHQSSVIDNSFTQEEVKSFSWRSWLKLIYIILFIGVLGLGAFILFKKMLFNQTSSEIKGEVLLQAPYQPVLWKDFGKVFEPIIKIPLYYPNKGFTKKEFLLDSGALVSSLPREEAKKMGLSLAKLQRSTFGGFGGTTSFAYKGETKIKLSDKEVVLPVVFTEAAGTKAILGRSGFFEQYSIYFNAKREMIEIRK